jgi:GNAT superfamily N-acetyltransferase
VTSHDFAAVQDIERAAGELFREIGMPEIAEDEPPGAKELGRYVDAGMAWVAEDADADPIGYLLARLVDTNLHVEQVSVHPRHARRGIGRALLQHASRYAAHLGVRALTLTTFEHVPWNAPYYRRCGFEFLDRSDWTPGLREIRERESAAGLDRWPRVCLRRPV